MNRNAIFGFVGGLLFAASVAVGALAADAARDNGGGELEVPGARGEPIPLVPGEDVTGLDSEPSFAGETGFVSTEVAGEFVLLDEAPPADAGGGGAEGDEPIGAGGGSAGEGDAEAGPAEAPADDSPPEGGGGYPWDVEDLFEGPFGSLLFDDPGFPFLRFFDFCAEDGAGCPFGVGGTVLAPFDDTLAVGEFRLRNQLYERRSPWWTCEAPSGLRSNEYFMLLSASHPARIEIDYYPTDDPGAAESTVVDLTDPADPSFTAFVDEVRETGHGPSTGVHHCFVLRAERRARSYTIEANATSFTGETDSATFGFTSDEQRSRPPIQVAPLSDYRATLVVTVKSEPRQSSLVRLIRPEEGLDCAAIEDATLARERRDVLARQPGQLDSDFFGREAIGTEIVTAPDWRYDPAYDAQEYWQLNLEEGNTYRACIWWLQSEGVRSFDPESARVVERETRWISTPDRLRAVVTVAGVEAPSSRGVRADSFILSGRTHCPALELPAGEIAAGEGVLTRGLVLCDYLGYQQPARTEITATFTDGSAKEFVIATPNTGEPRIEQVRLDLSQERASGLCGGSFGDCDPPTSTVPGPLVYLDVEFSDGDRGRFSWVTGEPFAFEPPPREPAELPELVRIDAFSNTIVATGRHSVQVTANFDRPVSLRAFIEGDLADQCFTGEIPSHTSAGLGTNHTFEMDGLCTLTSYLVGLEATDAAGTTTAFSDSPVPGESYWFGTAFTDGYDVTYDVAAVNTVVGRDYDVRWFNVEVAGRLTELRDDEDRCLDGGNRAPFRDATWGEVVTVEVSVRIGLASRRDGRCDAPYRSLSWWEASAVTSFTIEEFRAGTIVVRFPLDPLFVGSDRFPSGGMWVEIQGDVRR